MPINSKGRLIECKSKSNCELVEWEFDDVNKCFTEIVSIASSLPRIEVLESNSYYWHAICRSLVFRFPDDLEILKIKSPIGANKKGLIQIRSASRVGASDLGVNKKRLKDIYFKLMSFNKKGPNRRGL